MEPKNNTSEESDNLEHKAPNLSEIGNRNPFVIPDGYFDELPHIIQKRCQEQKKKIFSWEKLAFLFKPTFVLPIVMAVVLFAGSIYFIRNDNKSVSTYRTTDSISLTDNVQYIDEMLIIESFGTAGADDPEPIIDYLIDNDIETTTITNEL